MTSDAVEPEVPPSIARHVEQVAQLLHMICSACNLDSARLADQILKVADSENSVRQSVPFWASADMHLACTQVVFDWRRDGQFLDSTGNASVLDLDGSERSFERLCAKSAPGYRAKELQVYLEAMGAIRATDTGQVQLLTESVLACSAASAGAVAPDTILMHLQGFLGTVASNLNGFDAVNSTRFERACYGDIPSQLLPVFQRLVATRGQNFIDTIDEWLERHRSASDAESTLRVGAGAYTLVHELKY